MDGFHLTAMQSYLLKKPGRSKVSNLKRPSSNVASSCAVQSAGEQVTNLYFGADTASEEGLGGGSPVVAGGMRVPVKESMLWWCGVS